MKKKKLPIGESVSKIYPVEVDVFDVNVKITKMRKDNLNYTYFTEVEGWEEKRSMPSDRSEDLPENIAERAKEKALEKFRKDEREEREKTIEMKRTGAKDPNQENLFFEIK